MAPNEFHVDHVPQQLDELADVAEAWKRIRTKGGTPVVLRDALMQIVNQIHFTQQLELALIAKRRLSETAQ